MIEINIFKERLEKYKRKVLIIRFFIFYFSGLLFTFLICSGIFLSNKTMIDRVKKDIKILEEKIQSERMIFENLKEKDKKLQMLCEKCSLYSDEYKNRVLWSKILGLIGDSLPSGMWITKLSYKNDLTGGNKNLIVIVEGFISPFYINPDKGCLIFTRKLKEKGLGILENVSLEEIIKGEKEGNEIYYFKFAIKFKK